MLQCVNSDCSESMESHGRGASRYSVFVQSDGLSNNKCHQRKPANFAEGSLLELSILAAVRSVYLFELKCESENPKAACLNLRCHVRARPRAPRTLPTRIMAKIRIHELKQVGLEIRHETSVRNPRAQRCHVPWDALPVWWLHQCRTPLGWTSDRSCEQRCDVLSRCICFLCHLDSSAGCVLCSL